MNMTIFDIPRALVAGEASPEEYDIEGAHLVRGKSVSWEGVRYSTSPVGERLTIRKDGKTFKITLTQVPGQDKVITSNAVVDGHSYCEAATSIYLDGLVITPLHDGNYQVVGVNGAERLSQTEIDEMTPSWVLYNSTEPTSIFNFDLPGVLGK